MKRLFGAWLFLAVILSAVLLFARLLGRTLGHELGHILLNSRSHEDSGLMRARYRDRDVLSVPTSAYTLNAVERVRLFARMAGEPGFAPR